MASFDETRVAELHIRLTDFPLSELSTHCTAPNFLNDAHGIKRGEKKVQDVLLIVHAKEKNLEVKKILSLIQWIFLMERG